VIATLLLLLQQSPDSQYAGGASSRTAGTTALAGHFFRFLFSTVPQWVQLAGIFIGVPVAVIVAWQLWKRRRAISSWWLTKSLAFRAVLLGALFLVASAGLGSVLYGYNYMMHENDFCQACHVMDTPWNRFQVSAHKNIQCHGCHRQPLYVSTKELFWWVVERRMAVPPHDKVPTAVCSECHMRRGTDSARTLVTLTAGHALHLQSDSSALAKVECVTCHGRDFHQFKPTSTSCAQSGCHMNLPVNLGAMSRQGFMHCTSCHDFKGLVPQGTTARQAKLALVPRAMDCFSCHRMTEEIRRFDLAADKHEGNCGMCHDVHKQTTPADAYKSCATAQCHANADTLTAFHRGLGPHSLDRCSACHQAHSWKVKGTNCVACHQGINQDRPRARRSAASAGPAPVRRIGRGGSSSRRLMRLAGFVPASISGRPTLTPRHDHRAAAPPRGGADSVFRHSRHTSLACTTCHSTANTHGALRFTKPAGCNACHHGPKQRAACATCHTPTSLGTRAMPMTFAISARREPITRAVPFAHERHGALSCARCHGQGNDRPVTAKCSDCHAAHHAVTADCATCHATARAGHDRASHDGCAACHTDATVAALPSSRAVCLTCHQAQRTHYPAGDCATCHALADHGMMGAGRRSASR
jgi:hypothetical protein